MGQAGGKDAWTTVLRFLDDTAHTSGVRSEADGYGILSRQPLPEQALTWERRVVPDV